MDFINWLFYSDFGRGYLLGAVITMIFNTSLSAIRYYKEKDRMMSSVNSTQAYIKDSHPIMQPIGFRPMQTTAKIDSCATVVSVQVKPKVDG